MKVQAVIPAKAGIQAASYGFRLNAYRNDGEILRRLSWLVVTT